MQKFKIGGKSCSNENVLTCMVFIVSEHVYTIKPRFSSRYTGYFGEYTYFQLPNYTGHGGMGEEKPELNYIYSVDN